MKQKTLCVLALFAVLLFSACGENPIIDDSDIKQNKMDASGGTTREEDGNIVIVINGENDGGALATPQEEESWEPFDIDVFKAKRAVWEAKECGWHGYVFTQTHTGPGMSLSVDTEVPRQGIPKTSVLSPGENEADLLLRCSTISELYEKIDALWAEQRYKAASFLIKYEDFFDAPYPSGIHIKNINANGDDYTVYFNIHSFIIWVGEWVV
jgi:hypothetical protein